LIFRDHTLSFPESLSVDIKETVYKYCEENIFVTDITISYIVEENHQHDFSLAVTIPKQVCDLYSSKNGDKISIKPNGVSKLRL
jgi:hypothetical protein